MEISVSANNQSSPQAKITLFRSFFRGCEEVYPKRFENKKNGKSGYVFACGNEWVSGICEKPKIKCSDCKHRRLLPITDDVVHWHLSGLDNCGKDFVMGIYPMLLDETCFFLAADFDKASWTEDATAFLKTCHQMGLPAALERSRSGKGAHVWLFFSDAITAGLARKLGSHILTETMELRPDIGLDSYDRLFPNQDTLPKGGFGNLIALPLQKKARVLGNSVFVDENLMAYEDQWVFLSNLHKISRLEVENIVAKAEAKGRVVGVRLDIADEDQNTPWNLPPSRRSPSPPIGNVPKSLELVIGNQIYIAKEALSPGLRNRLIRLAAFQNPEFYKAQAMRFPTYEIPRIIACAEDHPNHIALPRGCFEDICCLLSDLNVKMILREELCIGQPLNASFQGQLRHEQQAAAEALLAHDIGVLSATTAFGKTVIAAWLIAQRQVNTLILVHRKQLQEQWIERLSTFLDVPVKMIGRIGGGRKKPKGLLDVALIQSLVRKGVVDDVVAQYGNLIIDECHHLPAQSFEQVTRQAKAKYITGLTATLRRKDGHHPIITMQCGPVRYNVNAKDQAAARPFEHTVLVRPTAFIPLKPANADARLQFNDLYDELVHDTVRNQLICEEVLKAVQNGRSPVILTERNEHLDLLSHQLAPHIRNLIVLRGGMSAKEIAQISSRLAIIPENEDRVLLATGRYIGEGFDDARLDTLFLTLPISWQGTIAQYVGRLHRLYDHKKEVQVYDYADLNVPILERMFNKRCRGYEAVGYKILLPASATPGWPTQAPLPVDPAWKNDYAASIKRLICDGVDMPLANLFVQVASTIHADAEGIDRARSTTEAFLYRRLETLPQTVGRFHLNALLSIPFDISSQMEVDLLCSDARLAVELDGAQHLADASAYRRDRRKDALLQQNGYMVLRFLSEDVGKHLDDVLDSILRALTHQEEKR
jgi:superfamily II DNA or RNA helicase/very-short-patch-repair endonuclease